MTDASACKSDCLLKGDFAPCSCRASSSTWMHGSDSRNGIWFHETIQSNHWCASIPISSIHGNAVPGPGILEYLDQVFGVHVAQS